MWNIYTRTQEGNQSMSVQNKKQKTQRKTVREERRDKKLQDI